MPALGTQVSCCARLTAGREIPCCPTCAASRCGRCEGLRGHHSPGCTAGFCQGCGERTAQAVQRKRGYCARCRAQACPECGRYAGQHGPRCRYVHRQRRAPRLLTVYDPPRVFEDNLVELFTACHRAAVRFTHYVGRVSREQAEDCVSQTFLWLWSRKDVLPALPTRTYVFQACLHRAADIKTSAWTRHVLAMDPEELVRAEEEAYEAGWLD